MKKQWTLKEGEPENVKGVGRKSNGIQLQGKESQGKKQLMNEISVNELKGSKIRKTKRKWIKLNSHRLWMIKKKK